MGRAGRQPNATLTKRPVIEKLRGWEEKLKTKGKGLSVKD